MKCFNCGAEVQPPAQFCGHCGTRVGDPHEETLMVPAEDQGDLVRRLGMMLAGEYEVEHELARGGMAVVLKATEVGLRRAVALKVLPPDVGLTPRAVERFKREARMVAELDHPNIIPVYRVGDAGGVLYIVMRFIEGRSLGAILEAQGALPVPVVLHVLRGASHHQAPRTPRVAIRTMRDGQLGWRAPPSPCREQASPVPLRAARLSLWDGDDARAVVAGPRLV